MPISSLSDALNTTFSAWSPRPKITHSNTGFSITLVNPSGTPSPHSLTFDTSGNLISTTCPNHSTAELETLALLWPLRHRHGPDWLDPHSWNMLTFHRCPCTFALLYVRRRLHDLRTGR